MKLYHVTQTYKVPRIRRTGLQPRKRTNWQEGFGARMGGDAVYAFENAQDAIRWAARMEWHLYHQTGKGRISILQFDGSGCHWEEDTNDPLSQVGRAGRWLKTVDTVPKEQIQYSWPINGDMIRAVVAWTRNLGVTGNGEQGVANKREGAI